jgi:ankyrin repeat protein
MGLFDKPRKIADVYVKLRNQVLSFDPVQIGLQPDQSNPIFGILMETGYKDAVVTLSAIGDGSVSLYFSNGGGIIGLGQHEEPRKACLSFLSFANQFLSHLQPTKEFPLPQKGYTSFYFLTIKGILAFTAKENDLGNNRLPVSPLFHKGQEVITQARLIDEKRQKDFQELIHGATTGDAHAVKKLIENGVNPNTSDPTGLTPLMAASHNGKVEILELLLNAGVPIDSKDSSGYTALMFSCNAGQISCAHFLIERGSYVNEVDNDGSTAIMFSAQHGYNDIVRLLLDKGADPKAKGNHGISAIGFAEQNGLEETKRILEGMDGV